MEEHNKSEADMKSPRGGSDPFIGLTDPIHMVPIKMEPEHDSLYNTHGCIVNGIQHLVRVKGCRLTFSITVDSLCINGNHKVPHEVHIDVSSALIMLGVLGYKMEDINVDSSMNNNMDRSVDLGCLDDSKDVSYHRENSQEKLDFMNESTDDEACDDLPYNDDALIQSILKSYDSKDQTSNETKLSGDNGKSLKSKGPRKKRKAYKASISKKVCASASRECQDDNSKEEASDNEEQLKRTSTTEHEEGTSVFGVNEGTKQKRSRKRPQKTHMCQICGYTTRNTTLTVHMRKHTGERPHHCTLCPASFAQAGSLHGHMLSHTGERSHMCATCGQSFGRIQHLKRHMRVHKKEEVIYKCKECGVSFSRAYLLKTHTKIHLDYKPFECTICGTKFARKGNLQTHMLTHTGEKIYMCTQCGVRFMFSYQLKDHLMVHRGEKYLCDSCPYTTVAARNLRKHKQIHHQ